MMTVNLSKKSGTDWYYGSLEIKKIYVKGYAFKDGVFLHEKKLLDVFLSILKRENIIADILKEIKKIVEELNGSFAVVISSKYWLFAAVDRVRSIPLFYGQRNNKLFISDDAGWIKKQADSPKMDEIASTEFVLTGYVTGQDTLFQDVKQIQAGECIWFKKNINSYKFDTHRYFRFLHENYFELPEEEISHLFNEVLIDIFERLIVSTQGKPILVPLSGGFDSRLIVSMLKMLGKNDVICFSYGTSKNWEAEISKKIANKLGYKWEFVPYNINTWEEYYKNIMRKKYFDFANGLTSVPISTNWPAVKKLKELGRIPDDAVFIPGHTGDFISGKHIPQEFLTMKRVGEDQVVKSILERHYILWDCSKLHEESSSNLSSRVLSRIAGLHTGSVAEAVDAYEYWVWQERQAKFIVNSVRVYEFWGYEWRMPLWDNDMINFWKRVGLQQRAGQKLYIDYLNRKLFAAFDIQYKPKEMGIVKKVLRKMKINIKNKSLMHFEPMYKFTENLHNELKNPANVHSYFTLIQLKEIRERFLEELLINH